MRFSCVVCLPDLLRGLRVYSEGVFDIVREPIRQGCGIDIGFSPEMGSAHSLLPGFELEEFRALSGVDTGAGQYEQWAASYYRINDNALDYLFRYLPEGAFILSLEMPPWLVQACFERRIDFLDISSSPLRFGRDLYIALRCSNTELFSRINSQAISEEEIRLEAALLAANVRMQQRRLEDDSHFRFDDLKGSILFIGQAPFDASLLTSGGDFLRCTDYSDQLRKLSQGKRLLYKPHPLALDSAKEERAALERISGQSVVTCQMSAYQILSSYDDVELVGISSGLLQEAQWFDKKAHILYRPFVPLFSSGESLEEHYQQIHFQNFSSPAFWHKLLTPERPAPRLAALPSLAHNHAREVFDLWWDYSKVLTWARTLPYEAFMRSGGAQFRDRIESLEKKSERGDLLHAREHVGDSGNDGLSRELLASLYSRLADGYLDVNEVLAKNTSPTIYQGKVLDAQYYQGLHDNNSLFQTNNWLLPYLNFIRNKKPLSVREIGCGNGAFSAAIAKSVERVVGLDWAKSPEFPEGGNVSFRQQDVTTADLEFFDLNCSADVLEHIEAEKLPALIESLHRSSRFNFHVIACYDDGHSHLSILPPDAWLFLFRRMASNYRILDISIRHDDISHVVCVVTNL